jgi:hypothetical protein
MIPLISSLCRGPLGAAQLPRFWWKNLLHATDRLDPGYPHNSGGLDRWVVELLGLDMDQTQAYLWSEKPDYLDFEDWVRAHGTIDPPALERWHKALQTRTHFIPAKIDETYGDIGFDKAEVTEVDAVLLNLLQDWQLFRANDLLGDGISAPFPPLLSSADVGPLGACQLPRTWLKTCLRASDLLHRDYPDCADGSLDQRCIATLQLDQDQTLAFLRDNMPTYLEFEEWVRTEGTIDAAAIAAFNERLLNREHIPAKLEDIHGTLNKPNDGTWTGGVLLNHLEDWKYAHTALLDAD